MITIRNRADLDRSERDWLQARHHFAVGPNMNPDHGPLGGLVVWNEDNIAPGEGFPFHGHQNMEIITYVREGKVVHRDSLGNAGETREGDVQVMSAGTGIRHEERSYAGGTTRIFQIWILPKGQGRNPCWGTKPFPKSDRAGRWVTLASGYGDDDAMPIYADARVLGATLLPGQTMRHSLENGRKAYLVPSAGRIRLNGVLLDTGDGAAIEDETDLDIEAEGEAELILVEVD